MSDDGADLGYGMEEALKGALGGEEPKHRKTKEEMREYILSAPDDPQSYDDYGRAIAKLVLLFMERYPETAEMPADSEYAWPNGYNAPSVITKEGLYEYINKTEPEYGRDVFVDMTGFQWGWGVNAARSVLNLPPVPNPAIITVGGPE